MCLRKKICIPSRQEKFLDQFRKKTNIRDKSTIEFDPNNSQLIASTNGSTDYHWTDSNDTIIHQEFKKSSSTYVPKSDGLYKIYLNTNFVDYFYAFLNTAHT